MSAPQQMYSGGEYATTSNAYGAADMQVPQGVAAQMHPSRYPHPTAVPSGYPAYALPGARYPVRGPGPPIVMQPQTYGHQHVAMPAPLSHQPMQMQVYGPCNAGMVAPLPPRAGPPCFGMNPRNDNPNQAQYHQGFPTSDPHQRVFSGPRPAGNIHPGARYPGYPVQNQVIPSIFPSMGTLLTPTLGLI